VAAVTWLQAMLMLGRADARLVERVQVAGRGDRLNCVRKDGRPITLRIKPPCEGCGGLGRRVTGQLHRRDGTTRPLRERCTACDGRGTQ
jgi:hypothetical protein